MTDQSKQEALEDQWLEFLVGDMCSLCGQVGIVDTRGIRTPAGFECGGLHYCICPNGRALKVRNVSKLEWLTQARRARVTSSYDKECLNCIANECKDRHYYGE
jgi:hypothetical protein